jgi:hypothetical protein
MKRTLVIAVAVLAFFAVLSSALPAEAGSRGTWGSFYISTPGLVINAGRPGGVSVFVTGGGPGYYFSGGYGPRFGYPGYRRHRHGPGHRYYRDPFPPYRHDHRWRRHYFDRHRDYPPARKWTSRTWVPGRMTSRGFIPGHWDERPLGP